MPNWLSAFGTGFMISPRLALTNNHVLPDAQSARLSQLEFNFQHGVSGLPLTTSQFDLEPDTFSRTDADLDVTIVAVAAKIARAANDDTFHFTNCSPQHKKFNQGASLWAGLEDHLLNTAKAEKLRLTVFTGPAFTASDPESRGIHIPLAFWKIPVFRRQDGSHSASAYMISQHQLVEDMLREAFTPATFQVPIRRVTELTGVDFTYLFGWDPMNNEFVPHPQAQEALAIPTPARELHTFDDLQL